MMPKMDETEFKFPDELPAAAADTAEPSTDELEIAVEDDTPPADRGREAMPKEMVESLDKEDLEEYSEKVKLKLQQMKKVYHDERREKERALREHQEAVALAQRVFEENKRLKATLSEGEKTLQTSVTSTAELELEAAKRLYREAYDAGDADKLLDAQEKMADAQYKLRRAKEYVPTPLQEEKEVVHSQPQVQAPRPDDRAVAWQKRNEWFGKDDEMTSLALGLHNKLVGQYGPNYATTDEYYKTIDETMRRRFPENFTVETPPGKPEQRTETPTPVVAPATRSTAPKKVVLKQSELNLAKRLGLTPEQYAREKLNLNGGR